MVLKFIPNLLGFFRAKNLDKLQEQQLYWQYETEFLKNTSTRETQVLRQLMVLTIFASLFFPAFGAMVVANMQRLPLWAQAILIWEFIGAAAFNYITGGKPLLNGGNGNGNTGGQVNSGPAPTNQGPGGANRN
jgi:amino acid transporter